MGKMWKSVVVYSLIAAFPLASSVFAASPEVKPTKVEVVGEVKLAPEVKVLDATTVPCDPSNELRSSDLCAQWKAADATQMATLWAIVAFVVGTIINVGTLIFVGFTFRQTQEAVRVAKNALAAEVRPWLSLEMKLEVDNLMESDKPGEAFRSVKYKLKNFGNAPALNAFVFILFIIDDGDIRKERARLQKLALNGYLHHSNLVFGQMSKDVAIYPSEKVNDFAAAVIGRDEVQRGIDKDGKVAAYLLGGVIYTSPGDPKPLMYTSLHQVYVEDEGRFVINFGTFHTDGMWLRKPGSVEAN